jgi:hypothetical protein
MTLALKRRWFRWSLRTMFVVVTVFACWLGYYGNWHRQRQSALRSIGDHGAEGLLPYLPRTLDTPTALPWSLKLWGERPVEFLWMHKLDSEDERAYLQRAEELHKLFPEARIFG